MLTFIIFIALVTIALVDYLSRMDNMASLNLSYSAPGSFSFKNGLRFFTINEGRSETLNFAAVYSKSRSHGMGIFKDYRFMNFKTGTNIVMNGFIIFALLWLIGHLAHSAHVHHQNKKANADVKVKTTRTFSGTSTIANSSKYVLPQGQQQQVVVRKSVGLYTARS